MMSSPWPSLVICVAYFVFVKMGPTIMANREPFELKKVLIVYNFCMVLLSTYCFVEVSTCWSPNSELLGVTPNVRISC